jgi:hypothetical protein
MMWNNEKFCYAKVALMIKKIWCFVWGHQFVLKAYFDEKPVVETMEHLILREQEKLHQWKTTMFYRYEQQKFCPRCGAPNPWFRKSDAP